MRLPPLAISILACAGMLAWSDAETHTFIDQSGRALEGELVNVSGPMVTIKRAGDGQMFTMPANSFSKSDQAYIGRKASVMPAPTAAPNPPAKTAVPAGSNAT